MAEHAFDVLGAHAVSDVRHLRLLLLDEAEQGGRGIQLEALGDLGQVPAHQGLVRLRADGGDHDQVVVAGVPLAHIVVDPPADPFALGAP